MSEDASNQQLELCRWCDQIPEARFVVDQVSALRCVNMACPVSHAGWISVFMWTTSRVSDGGVVATVDEVLPIVKTAAKQQCREYEWGCASYGSDVTRWCVPCFARRMIATASPAVPKFCGFCRKDEHEVKALISAAVGYICNECVAICASILERNGVAAPKEEAHERWVKLLANAISTATPTLFPERGQDTYYVLSLESLNGLREIHREIAQRLWGPATTPSPDEALTVEKFDAPEQFIDAYNAASPCPAREAAEEIAKYLDAFTPLTVGDDMVRRFTVAIQRHCFPTGWGESKGLTL